MVSTLRKRVVLGLLVALAALALGAAEPAKFTISTGDPALDALLLETEALAAIDFEGFLANLSADYKVSLKELKSLRGLGLHASEILLVVDLAKTWGKPVGDLSNAWKASKTKVWSDIFKSLGLKPGSDVFVKFKKNMLVARDGLKKNEGNAMKRAGGATDGAMMKADTGKGDPKPREGAKP